MKVNNTGVKSAQTAALNSMNIEKKSKADKNVKTSVDSKIENSSKINMSSEAQAFQKAKAIASQDTVDEAKVARLQKLIDSGKYKVDASAVAERLVDEHLLTGE